MVLNDFHIHVSRYYLRSIHGNTMPRKHIPWCHAQKHGNTMVLVCYFEILRKNISKHCLSSEKVTCRPLDKGQKSTRCTSLRKLLGIFTVTLMMHNTNKDCSPNTPSLSHLVSSITGGAPAVFSSAHKSENTHLLLFYRHLLSFRDAIGRAMEKHPMLLELNSRTRAHALHPETRELQASSSRDEMRRGQRCVKNQL